MALAAIFFTLSHGLAAQVPASASVSLAGKQDAKAWMARGAEARAAKRYQDAVDAYSKAIAIDPRNSAAYDNRGNAYRQLRDLASARRDFDEALRLKPDNAVAHYNRALLVRQLGDAPGYEADMRASARLGFPRAKEVVATLGPEMATGPVAAEVQPHQGQSLPAPRPAQNVTLDKAHEVTPVHAQTMEPPRPAHTIDVVPSQPMQPGTPADRVQPASPSPQPLVPKKPSSPAGVPDAAATWTGSWSVRKDWGTFILTQQGNRISGQIVGGWAEGRISGTATGRDIQAQFQRTGSSHIDGQVLLSMAPGDRAFTGQWKFAESPVWAASTLAGSKTSSKTDIPDRQAANAGALVGTWYGVGSTVGTIVLKSDGTYDYVGRPSGKYKVTRDGADFTGGLGAWNGGHATLKNGNLEFYWTNPNGGINYFAFSK